jgi:hypothetical protein
LDEELELSSREELIKKVKLLDAQNRAIAQTKSQVRASSLSRSPLPKYSCALASVSTPVDSQNDNGVHVT